MNFCSIAVADTVHEMFSLPVEWRIGIEITSNLKKFHKLFHNASNIIIRYLGHMRSRFSRVLNL